MLVVQDTELVADICRALLNKRQDQCLQVVQDTERPANIGIVLLAHYYLLPVDSCLRVVDCRSRPTIDPELPRNAFYS